MFELEKEQDNAQPSTHRNFCPFPNLVLEIGKRYGAETGTSLATG